MLYVQLLVFAITFFTVTHPLMHSQGQSALKVLTDFIYLNTPLICHGLYFLCTNEVFINECFGRDYRV